MKTSPVGGQSGTSQTVSTEKVAGLPASLFLALGIIVAVVAASAVLGPVTAPEFFITYAVVQAAVFLGLIYLADLYDREPLTVVALMALWGGTSACLFALPGNEFVNRILPADIEMVFGPAIAAPVVEETAKGVALLLGFWLSQIAARHFGAHSFEGVSDGIVYGAAIGLGFAFTEDIFYFYGVATQTGMEDGWDLFRTRVDLFGLNMLGHSIFTGMTGVGLGLATVTAGGRRVMAAVLGFAAAVLAHASHNGLVNAVLTIRYGLASTAAALDNRQVPDGLLDDVESTARLARAVSDFIGFLLVVGAAVAVALWIRHQQHIIATELSGEDPEVVSPDEVRLVVHYPARLRAYTDLVLAGRVEDWRLSRVVHAELTELAFLKWRARTGRANPAQLDRQRYLAAWAQAALTANRTRPDRGSKELLVLSDAALRSSRYDLTESLLEVRSELVVPDDVTRGMMAIVAGRHLAESAFRFEEASEQYTKAIAAFDRALTRDPADANAHLQRSGALFRLGEAQLIVGRRAEAVVRFREAVAATDRALELDPGVAESHRNRAAALMRLGEAEVKGGHYGEARTAFSRAVTDVETTLSLTPEDGRAYNIAGLAYMGRGEAERHTGLHDEARASFRAAIDACRQAVALVPDFAYARHNLATAWRNLADIEAEAGDADTATDAYQRAVAGFEEALATSPGYVKALIGRSGALTSLGRLQLGGGYLDAAAATAERALGSADDAHRRTLGYGPAHAGRAEALLLVSEVQARRGATDAAGAAAQEAVEACGAAVGAAPDDFEVRLLRAEALIVLGRWRMAQNDVGGARHCAAEARLETEFVLRIAGELPDPLPSIPRILQEARRLGSPGPDGARSRAADPD